MHIQAAILGLNGSLKNGHEDEELRVPLGRVGGSGYNQNTLYTGRKLTKNELKNVKKYF